MPSKAVVLDGLDVACVHTVLFHIRDDPVFAFVEEPLEVLLVLLIHLIPGKFEVYRGSSQRSDLKFR